MDNIFFQHFWTLSNDPKVSKYLASSILSPTLFFLEPPNQLSRLRAAFQFQPSPFKMGGWKGRLSGNPPGFQLFKVLELDFLRVSRFEDSEVANYQRETNG